MKLEEQINSAKKISEITREIRNRYLKNPEETIQSLEVLISRGDSPKLNALMNSLASYNEFLPLVIRYSIINDKLPPLDRIIEYVDLVPKLLKEIPHLNPLRELSLLSLTGDKTAIHEYIHYNTSKRDKYLSDIIEHINPRCKEFLLSTAQEMLSYDVGLSLEIYTTLIQKWPEQEILDTLMRIKELSGDHSKMETILKSVDDPITFGERYAQKHPSLSHAIYSALCEISGDTEWKLKGLEFMLRDSRSIPLSYIKGLLDSKPRIKNDPGIDTMPFIGYTAREFLTLVEKIIKTTPEDRIEEVFRNLPEVPLKDLLDKLSIPFEDPETIAIKIICELRDRELTTKIFRKWLRIESFENWRDFITQPFESYETIYYAVRSIFRKRKHLSTKRKMEILSQIYYTNLQDLEELLKYSDNPIEYLQTLIRGVKLSNNKLRFEHLISIARSKDISDTKTLQHVIYHKIREHFEIDETILSMYEEYYLNIILEIISSTPKEYHTQFYDALKSYKENTNYKYKDAPEFWRRNIVKDIEIREEDYSEKERKFKEKLEEIIEEFRREIMELYGQDIEELEYIPGIDREQFISSLVKFREFTNKISEIGAEDIKENHELITQHIERFTRSMTSLIHLRNGNPREIYIKGEQLKDIVKNERQFNKLEFKFTDDLQELLRMSDSPYIFNCQSPQYAGGLKAGIVGSITNQWVKMFTIYDENHTLVARAKAYLTLHKEKPIIVVDRMYGKTSMLPLLNLKIQEILDEWAEKELIDIKDVDDDKLRPYGKFNAPIYTDVGLFGKIGLIYPT